MFVWSAIAVISAAACLFAVTRAMSVADALRSVFSRVLGALPLAEATFPDIMRELSMEIPERDLLEWSKWVTQGDYATHEVWVELEEGIRAFYLEVEARLRKLEHCEVLKNKPGLEGRKAEEVQQDLERERGRLAADVAESAPGLVHVVRRYAEKCSAAEQERQVAEQLAQQEAQDVVSVFRISESPLLSLYLSCMVGQWGCCSRSQYVR